MRYPDFTEIKDDNTLLFFRAEGENIAEMQKELEKMYACCSAVSVTEKNGEKYIALEIENSEKF